MYPKAVSEATAVTTLLKGIISLLYGAIQEHYKNRTNRGWADLDWVQINTRTAGGERCVAVGAGDRIVCGTSV